MIYCDHNAGTPLRPEVLDKMHPFLGAAWGNASSVHAWGGRARAAVEDARVEVAALLGASPAEIVFTSGGTESNNLAILGAPHVANGRVITTGIEHASVRGPIALLRRRGYEVLELPVDATGAVTASAVARACSVTPAFVSIGWANNEIGVLQPIGAIAAECAARGALLHVDAVQAAGKVPVCVTGVDLLSLSAHKLGGPQGVGALYVRRGITLQPLLIGGGQERGRRPGTENVAGIVGFGEACRLAAGELSQFARACAVMRERLWAGLARIPGVRRNSPAGADCLPNTLHVSFEGVRGETLVAALDLEAVAVSSGSACAAGAAEPSHVLRALGHSEDAARDGVRFSFGRGNTAAEVGRIIAVTTAAVERARGATPARPAAVNA
jgi:cysteine desulfurase